MALLEHDKRQESLAMLKLLEMSAADVEAGRVRDSEEVFAEAHQRIVDMRKAQEHRDKPTS